MAELTADDVETYTGGRLAAADAETQRMLDAALVAARRDVGWPVSPVVEDADITVDGPGGYRLWLPTQKIVSVSGITEDGDTTSLSDVVAAVTPGLLVKPTGYWSTKYAGITVTLDHGFTEAEAADWRQAILQIVSDMASGVARSDADLVSKKVDDVEYRWGDAAAEAVYRADSVLRRYRLLGGWA